MKAADPRERNVKRRPAVVLSDGQDITADGRVVAVAISSTFTEPLPPEQVELPWEPQGRAVTGFRRRCVAVCRWAIDVAADDVEPTPGHVPPAIMRQIIEQVRRLAP